MSEQSGEHVHYWDDGRVDGKCSSTASVLMASGTATPRSELLLSWILRSSPRMVSMSTSTLYGVKLESSIAAATPAPTRHSEWERGRSNDDHCLQRRRDRL